MASVNMFLAPATAITANNPTGNTITTTNSIIITTRSRRVHTFATAAKGSGKSREEKGFFDWLGGALQKEDGFVETDPILQKVEGKSGSTTVVTGKKTTTTAAPPKKSGGDESGFGGFGGLFSKK